MPLRTVDAHSAAGRNYFDFATAVDLVSSRLHNVEIISRAEPNLGCELGRLLPGAFCRPNKKGPAAAIGGLSKASQQASLCSLRQPAVARPGAVFWGLTKTTLSG